MDEISKFKTWKVALSHLLLSVLIFVVMITDLGGLFELLLPIFIFFQPVFSLLEKAAASKNHLFVDQNTMSASTLTSVVSFLSFPVWSLFFGWLFANVVNRLKGFPFVNRQS